MFVRNRVDARWHLGAFYFFYFASLGAFIPYWGLYLADLDYSPAVIGGLTALLMITKVLAPYFYGWLADHSRSRLRMIRIGTFLSALCFSMIFLTGSVWQIVLVILGFSFFWNAILPQLEVVTMIHLGDATRYYSRIRLWGSVGFIISAVILAGVVNRYGLGIFPVFVLLLLILLWLDTLWLIHGPEPTVVQPENSFWKHCASVPMLSLLLFCFLNQVSHGPYYAFFSLYLKQHAYPVSSIGVIWSLGVVAEIGVFMVVHRWLPALGAVNLLIISMTVSCLRWLLLAFGVTYWPVLVIVQLMHAGSFGLFHAAAIHIIDQNFRGSMRGRGQALYSSISFGLGGAVGSMASGYVWTDWGGRWLFTIAAGVAFLGLAQFLAAGRLAFRYNKRLF